VKDMVQEGRRETKKETKKKEERKEKRKGKERKRGDVCVSLVRVRYCRSSSSFSSLGRRRIQSNNFQKRVSRFCKAEDY
jgi:hypothetical protein